MPVIYESSFLYIPLRMVYSHVKIWKDDQVQWSLRLEFSCSRSQWNHESAYQIITSIKYYSSSDIVFPSSSMLLLDEHFFLFFSFLLNTQSPFSNLCQLVESLCPACFAIVYDPTSTSFSLPLVETVIMDQRFELRECILCNLRLFLLCNLRQFHFIIQKGLTFT